MRNPKDSEKSKRIKCSKDHELTKCSEFQKASLRSRWRLAQSKQLCFKCLKGGHRSEDCKHGNACQEPDCDNNFHHLLHYHQKKASSVTDKKTEIQKREEEHPTVEKSKENEDSNYMKKSASHRITLRTAPVILANGNKRIKAIAFLDGGSTGTYIREDIAEYLGLKGEMTSLKISTVTGSENLDTQGVQACIESRDGTFSLIIRAWTKQSITPGLKVINWNNHKKQWPHLNSIKFPNVLHHGSVDILIGVDAIDLHKTIEEVQGGPGETIARRTPLGWTCVGSLEKNYPLKEHEILYHAQEYKTLDALLRQFCGLDSIGLADTDDQRSLMEKDEMQKVANTRRKVNGYSMDKRPY